MKIIAISMVKNEMDIIESFVRHTLSFADELLICDHQSTDATRDILEKLRAEGLPLDIRTEYRAAHVQAEVMSNFLREAAEERGADLIVPLDADEFLLPKTPGDVRASLEALSPEGVYSVNWQFYVPVGGTEAEFLLTRPLRRVPGEDECFKCIVGGAAVRRERLCLVEGSHSAYKRDDPHHWSVPMERFDGTLAHFYWRSEEQFRAKAVVAWMNIAAKYSVDAVAGGGYRAISAKAAAGKTPSWQERYPVTEPADLQGYAKMQALCYSDGTRPDAFQNLVAAGNALAENYAILQAEEKQARVTSVVPFFGEEDPFRKSLSSVCDEVFPRHEILVPVMAGALSPSLAKSLMRLAAAGKVSVLGDARLTGGDIFDALQTRATGDFVEWVLPGETVVPQKLRAMVASILLQDEALAFYISDGAEEAAAAVPPYHSLGATLEDNVARITTAVCYRWMLHYGVVPQGGMSALLMRREHMDDCQWFRSCMMDGHPVLFSMFRALLLSPAIKDYDFVGVMVSCYHGPSPKMTLPEQALHQLVWGRFLQEEGQDLSEKQRGEAEERFRRNGIQLLTQALEAGADTGTGLWQAYQAMLRDA